MTNKYQSVKVQVPATSANCGPGFDCLGLAVNMYNTFTYELLPSGQLELEVEGEGRGQMKASAKNLAFHSFYKLWNMLKPDTPVGLRVHMKNVIPLSRGLGSSSSAIVAGLMAANAMTGETLTKEELVALATEIEGHPDNVAPALLGGFTISLMKEGKAHAIKIEPTKKVQLVALIPAMPLATSAARAALPPKVPMADAVFSASRAALLVAAILQGNYAHLDVALEDKLHQPYRLPLIPGAQEALAAAKAAGAYQGILSGAGSTLMAYVPVEADGDAVGKAMQAALAAKHSDSRYVILDIDMNGAQII